MADAGTPDEARAADSGSLVRELQALLNHHSALYYADKPEIPDGDFDDMLRQLKALEAQHPELVYPIRPPGGSGPPPTAPSRRCATSRR